MTSTPIPGPRARRLALAAIAATCVVGVTGPFITWQAASSGQETASKDQRIRDDLVELRNVLGTSLRDLDHLRTVMGPELVAWENRAPRRIHMARHLSSDKAYAKAKADADRIAILVGQQHRLWRTYNRAVGESFGASLFTYRHKYARLNGIRYAQLSNKGNAAEIQFRGEALRVVGTKFGNSISANRLR